MFERVETNGEEITHLVPRHWFRDVFRDLKGRVKGYPQGTPDGRLDALVWLLSDATVGAQKQPPSLSRRRQWLAPHTANRLSTKGRVGLGF